MGIITKDVDFLFIYETRNREIDSICLLGAYLEEKGYRVGYINTWDSMYHRHPEYRTGTALLSACYGDGEYAFFTGHALKFEKVVNLQWEQVIMNGVAFSKGKTDWDYSGEALRTRHVSWGENNRDYLHDKFGIDYAMTRVCGYLPLDFYREELRGATAERDALFSRFGLDPKRKTLLFISSFAEAGKPVSEAAVVDDDEQESRENILLQETSQQILLDWFRQLIRDEEGIQVVYRPHPAEANNPAVLRCAREVPDFHVIQQESIRNLIMNCDILCNWQSTSMIELYTAGKKALILRPKEIPFKRAMPIFEEGHFTAVKTYGELLAGVREEHPAFPVEEDRLLRFYSVTDRPAYERVGQYLIDTLQDPDYRSRDIGGHASAKGRILHRAQRKASTLKSRAVRSVYRLLGGDPESPRGRKIEEDYIHYRYFVQMMRQNRISPRELRRKIDSYRTMIRKQIQSGGKDVVIERSRGGDPAQN